MPSVAAPLRVSAVSYFNTVTLIDGLAEDPRVRLTRRVPSALIDDLRDGSADVALLPTIAHRVSTQGPPSHLRQAHTCCSLFLPQQGASQTGVPHVGTPPSLQILGKRLRAGE